MTVSWVHTPSVVVHESRKWAALRRGDHKWITCVDDHRRWRKERPIQIITIIFARFWRAAGSTLCVKLLSRHSRQGWCCSSCELHQISHVGWWLLNAVQPLDWIGAAHTSARAHANCGRRLKCQWRRTLNVAKECECGVARGATLSAKWIWGAVCWFGA